MEEVTTDSGRVEGSQKSEVNNDIIILDGFPLGASEKLELDANSAAKGKSSSKKRKRASIDVNLLCEGKGAFLLECQKELDELFKFYKGVSSYKLHLEEGYFASLNNAVACLLEESSLAFSKVVEEIYGKLKMMNEILGVTLASVRSAVLFVGQRMMYGTADEDIDVLEDESYKCLWCWETRDFKLLPKILRSFFHARRVSRRKIHERIFALSAIISAMSISQTHKDYKSDLMRLGKTLNLSGIRTLVENLMQRSCAEMAEKEAKLKEKELIKEQEKNKQSTEKEKKKIDREIQKEKQQAEKEIKRVHEEAAKEEKRREKEEAELRKQIKKQEELAKRDQWKQVKEASEMKKQVTIQKQAKIMERFLNCKKVSTPLISTREPTSKDTSSSGGGVDRNTITSLMDHALYQQESLAVEDLRREHIDGWHKACRFNRSNRWGVRRKPKANLFQDLKLQGSAFETEPLAKVAVPDKHLGSSKLSYSRETTFDMPLTEHIEAVSNFNADKIQACYPSVRKLLQFDKSNRPAYYGTLGRKSGTIGPRHPFHKDSELDYEVESEEEWAEEEPGESLSDCEKDKEDELLDDENIEDDDNESEDSFLVPDGYLSENEVVQFDNTSDGAEDECGNSTSSQMDTENDEFRALFQQQKYLNSLTEQALRKCQPLMITNLMHEKTASISVNDLVGTAKLEQICLQSLCIRALPGVAPVDISIDHPSNKDHAHCLSQGKDTSTPSAPAAAISDSDLPDFVRAIQSSPNSINKAVASLQQKFSNISKSRIRNAIREISEFADNRWQVKKDVMVRLGLSISPDKCSGRPKGIAMFFSKRCCLHPREDSMKIQEPSSGTGQCDERADLQCEDQHQVGSVQKQLMQP